MTKSDLPFSISFTLTVSDQPAIVFKGVIPMDGQSISDNLLFSIVAETPESELTPFEKLFVALNSNRPCHAGYLTDIYMACGCFEQAREAYAAADHQRKLGDICWIQGDLDAAERHYMAVEKGAPSYRQQSNDDRLIKIAFFQEQWTKVVKRFAEASFSRGLGAGRVCCGNSETAARPFLEMLVIALLHVGQGLPARIQTILTSAFRLTPQSWAEFNDNPVLRQRATIEKIKKRCPPRPSKNPLVSVEAALIRGTTARSKQVLTYIHNCDDLLAEAKINLERYGQTGDDASLQTFIEIVTRSGIASVSHSFLFSAMGNDSFAPPNAPPERMARLYGVHPIMNKRYFGKLLQVKFEHHQPLTGGDIVTGLFQQMGSITTILEPESVEAFFGPGKLAHFRDWAELRLSDWITGHGAGLTEMVATVWREGKARLVAPPFGGGANRPPDTPRNMDEWSEMLSVAAQWLETRWKGEIGATPWVSENQLYQLLKRQLKGLIVQQHAQPTWISPQHLDVFIPEVPIAVEYMGRQHYEPVEFFGGDAGFRDLQLRDRRKQEACAKHGIDLRIVKHDEDIGARARAIVDEVMTKKGNT